MTVLEKEFMEAVINQLPRMNKILSEIERDLDTIKDMQRVKSIEVQQK